VNAQIRPVDTLVVGGGLNGCALAYYLAEEGITDVLVAEGAEHGSGATGGSMGNVRQQFGTPLEIECSRRGLAFWKNIGELLGAPVPFHDDGYLMVTGDEGTAAILTEQAGAQRAAGMPDVHLLTAAQIPAVAPFLDPSGLVLGSWTPSDGHVMPMDGLTALAGAARRRGVRIEQHWPVHALQRSGGRWHAHGPRGTVTAERVIIAAGAGSRVLLRPLGVDLDIAEAVQYSLLTGAALPGTAVPTVIDVDTGMCVEREGQGLLLAMLARNPAPRDHDHLAELFYAAATVRAPSLLDLDLTHRLTAHPTLGGDGHPYVGQAAGNLWALAFTGHGAMHGPPVAQALAREVAGRPDTSLDLSPWSLHRRPGPRSVLWRREAAS
jgi:glycine/D-amino acid oxidase-like deaminating enzyme